MDKKIRALLRSRYRKTLWENSQRIINEISETVPISSAYVMGSFTTKKKRPADVDFIVLLKEKGRHRNEKWSVDLVIMPDNKHGRFIMEDTKKWMKQKYGANKSAVIKIK